MSSPNPGEPSQIKKALFRSNNTPHLKPDLSKKKKEKRNSLDLTSLPVLTQQFECPDQNQPLNISLNPSISPKPKETPKYSSQFHTLGSNRESKKFLDQFQKKSKELNEEIGQPTLPLPNPTTSSSHHTSPRKGISASVSLSPSSPHRIMQKLKPELNLPEYKKLNQFKNFRGALNKNSQNNSQQNSNGTIFEEETSEESQTSSKETEKNDLNDSDKRIRFQSAAELIPSRALPQSSNVPNTSNQISKEPTLEKSKRPPSSPTTSHIPLHFPLTPITTTKSLPPPTSPFNFTTQNSSTLTSNPSPSISPRTGTSPQPQPQSQQEGNVSPSSSSPPPSRSSDTPEINTSTPVLRPSGVLATTSTPPQNTYEINWADIPKEFLQDNEEDQEAETTRGRGRSGSRVVFGGIIGKNFLKKKSPDEFNQEELGMGGMVGGMAGIVGGGGGMDEEDKKKKTFRGLTIDTTNLDEHLKKLKGVIKDTHGMTFFKREDKEAMISNLMRPIKQANQMLKSVITDYASLTREMIEGEGEDFYLYISSALSSTAMAVAMEEESLESLSKSTMSAQRTQVRVLKIVSKVENAFLDHQSMVENSILLHQKQISKLNKYLIDQNNLNNTLRNRIEETSKKIEELKQSNYWNYLLNNFSFLFLYVVILVITFFRRCLEKVNDVIENTPLPPHIQTALSIDSQTNVNNLPGGNDDSSLVNRILNQNSLSEEGRSDVQKKVFHRFPLIEEKEVLNWELFLFQPPT